jgi:hypothetical protein
MSGFRIASAVITLSLVGCTETPVPQVETSSEVPVLSPLPDDPAAPGPAPQIDPPSEFAPLSLNGSGGTEQSGASMASDASLAGEASRQSIMKNLKPLQVMLGNWRGTTRKEYGDSKAVDLHEWIWDLQTDRKQPALVLKSDKSPYLQIARLTWVADIAKFSLTATNSDGVTREYVGDYTDPVHEIVGPDDKMHRVFRLELTQTEESAKQEGGETWQVAFTQQENNRYLVDTTPCRLNAKARRSPSAILITATKPALSRRGSEQSLCHTRAKRSGCVAAAAKQHSTLNRKSGSLAQNSARPRKSSEAGTVTAYYAELWPRGTRFDGRKPPPASECR